MSTILVTGSDGFIGANLVMRLLRTPDQVVGDVKGVGGDDGLTIVVLDNMNDYYDVSLKESGCDRSMRSIRPCRHARLDRASP